LDLWDTALPFLERWIKERYSPKNMLRQAEYHLPDWLEHLPELPDLVYANLLKNKDNEIALNRLLEQQNQSHRWVAVCFSSAIVVVSLLFFLK
jgi:ubiquinone biosynthesis protein